MFIVGIGVYAFTSSQLSEQKITVAAVTADDPGSLAGKPVAGPFTALAQVNAIKHHIASATGGLTYGELGNVATADGQTYNKDLTAEQSTDGQAHKAGDPLSAADAKTYAARDTAQQGSFLQASLLVSVIAFGVAVLIMGLGLMFIVISVALVSMNRAKLRRE
uniref:Aromatic ring-opening dioxygenase LigA n=1 Tax=termite gut metagenome TaxID=433724 RepID=S0DDL0_9ZZZZ